MNLARTKTVKNSVILILVVLLVLGCRAGAVRRYIRSGGERGNSTEGQESVAGLSLGDLEVSAQPNYTVQKIPDVKYGEGLSHTRWNSDETEVVDLLLDVYLPNDDGERTRPVVVYIHGGGFTGGDKDISVAREMLGHFVERGFVGMSINYRVLGDYATYPAEIDEAINAGPELTNKQEDQARAMYGANRDAKAAIRWIYANAAEYNIDTNHITVIGGSAGSIISVTLGVTNPEDFRDELSLEEDPTLATTHLEYDSAVHTVINHWGGPSSVGLLEAAYGIDRWDSSDAPISIVHGTEDITVPYSQAEAIVARYEATGAPYVLHTLDGVGHGAWQSEIDGKSLDEAAFEFVVETQDLVIVE